MTKNTKSNGRRKRAPKGAGTLFKRDATGKGHPAEWNGTGNYWLAYTIPNPKGGMGKRIRQPLRDERGNPITDRAQAELERRRTMAPYLTGDHVETLKAIARRIQDAETAQIQAEDEANPPLRIKDTWRAYLQAPERPDSGPFTLAQYEGHLNRFENWITATHPEAQFLRDVSSVIAGEYAGDLHAATLSGNRFNKHIGFLKLAFRVLAEPARITMNPFEKIRRKNQKAHSRRELTMPELKSILDAASGDMALLLYLGAATGLRLGDCCTLQWGEVDLARGIIRRIPSKTAKSGKPVVIGIPRTLHEKLSGQRGRRGYVLPAIAKEYQQAPVKLNNAIRDHFLECGIDVHAPGTGSRIKRDDGGNPIRDKAGKVITEDTGKPAVVEAGFHSLRHTWVSMHAAAGTPGAVIQASVGHANPSMTAHYTHVNEVTARDVARALPAFTGNGEEVKAPLPAWARKLVESLTKKNIDRIKAELLKGGEA